MQMNHCHLERRGKNLSICKSLGTCKSHLRERPANHKPGDGIGPSPDRPENAEATQKMIEKKLLDLRKVSWAVQKLLGAPKVFSDIFHKNLSSFKHHAVFKCVDYMSSSSSVLEELLLSLLLDWFCRLACFDLTVTNHLQREQGALASPSPASDITLASFFSGSGAVHPFEDEPNAAVVAALVPGCVGVGSRMLGLGIAWGIALIVAPTDTRSGRSRSRAAAGPYVVVLGHANW